MVISTRMAQVLSSPSSSSLSTSSSSSGLAFPLGLSRDLDIRWSLDFLSLRHEGVSAVVEQLDELDELILSWALEASVASTPEPEVSTLTELLALPPRNESYFYALTAFLRKELHEHGYGDDLHSLLQEHQVTLCSILLQDKDLQAAEEFARKGATPNDSVFPWRIRVLACFLTMCRRSGISCDRIFYKRVARLATAGLTGLGRKDPLFSTSAYSSMLRVALELTLVGAEGWDPDKLLVHIVKLACVKSSPQGLVMLNVDSLHWSWPPFLVFHIFVARARVRSTNPVELLEAMTKLKDVAAAILPESADVERSKLACFTCMLIAMIYYHHLEHDGNLVADDSLASTCITEARKTLNDHESKESESSLLACTWALRALGAIMYKQLVRVSKQLQTDEDLLHRICLLAIRRPYDSVPANLQCCDSAVKLLRSMQEGRREQSNGLRLAVCALRFLGTFLPQQYRHTGTAEQIATLWQYLGSNPDLARLSSARPPTTPISNVSAFTVVKSFAQNEKMASRLCARSDITKALLRSEPNDLNLYYASGDTIIKKFQRDCLERASEAARDSTVLPQAFSATERLKQMGFVDWAADVVGAAWDRITEELPALQLSLRQFVFWLLRDTLSPNQRPKSVPGVSDLPANQRTTMETMSGTSPAIIVRLDQPLTPPRDEAARVISRALVEHFQVDAEIQYWYHGTSGNIVDRMVPPCALEAKSETGDFAGAPDSWNSFYITPHLDIAICFAEKKAIEQQCDLLAVFVFRKFAMDNGKDFPMTGEEADFLDWKRFVILSAMGASRFGAAQCLRNSFQLPFKLQYVDGPMSSGVDDLSNIEFAQVAPSDPADREKADNLVATLVRHAIRNKSGDFVQQRAVKNQPSLQRLSENLQGVFLFNRRDSFLNVA